MSDNPSGFTGDIPTFYDTGLGPNIFHDYADKLAQRCSELAALNVVEIAAGTGILSRRLRDALSPEATLVVTDLNGLFSALLSRKRCRPSGNLLICMVSNNFT